MRLSYVYHIVYRIVPYYVPLCVLVDDGIPPMLPHTVVQSMHEKWAGLGWMKILHNMVVMHFLFQDVLLLRNKMTIIFTVSLCQEFSIFLYQIVYVFHLCTVLCTPSGTVLRTPSVYHIVMYTIRLPMCTVLCTICVPYCVCVPYLCTVLCTPSVYGIVYHMVTMLCTMLCTLLCFDDDDSTHFHHTLYYIYYTWCWHYVVHGSTYSTDFM